MSQDTVYLQQSQLAVGITQSLSSQHRCPSTHDLARSSDRGLRVRVPSSPPCDPPPINNSTAGSSASRLSDLSPPYHVRGNSDSVVDGSSSDLSSATESPVLSESSGRSRRQSFDELEKLISSIPRKPPRPCASTAPFWFGTEDCGAFSCCCVARLLIYF